MPQDDIPYGAARSVEELGRLARAHRKQRHLPDILVTVSRLCNLRTRSLPLAVRAFAHEEEGRTQLVASLLP
jgi:hypothetical protein